MESWRFVFTIIGQKDLDSLDPPVRKRVSEKLLWFRENFSAVIPFPLGGPLSGFFKLRVGEWRVVYEIDQKKMEIIVHVIDLRDRIYKRARKLIRR
ncbi:MAG: type II toxin-antitoxin system RelE/ParE family toxin [Patescibacteria group bacterium]